VVACMIFTNGMKCPSHIQERNISQWGKSPIHISDQKRTVIEDNSQVLTMNDGYR
jgi:hypothetical protein